MPAVLPKETDGEVHGVVTSRALFEYPNSVMATYPS